MGFPPNQGPDDDPADERVAPSVTPPATHLGYLERDYVNEGFDGLTELRVHGVSAASRPWT